MRPVEIIAAADTALYEAKRNGGNRACCASSTAEPVLDKLDTSSDDETLSMIYTLAASVDARDRFNGNHSKRVQKYAVAMGEALHLDEDAITVLSNGALLHDVGKVGIGNEILNKVEKLEEAEIETLRTHSRLGATIVSRAANLVPCAEIVLHHHEKYDGSGYPHGIRGEEIPLGARILAIADAYAAMTSERPYSKALSRQEALDELRREAGKQFDPHLVEIFISLVKSNITVKIESS